MKEAKQKQEQALWDRQLKTAEMGMKLVENKNLDASIRINAFNNGVRPVLVKMGLNMPEMTAPLLKNDAYQQAFTSSMKTIEDMQKGKVDSVVGMTSITNNFGGVLKDMESETEAQKTQREMVFGLGKDIASKSEANSKAGKDKQDNAIKRSTELGQMYANLVKTGTMDPEKVKNDPNPAIAALATLFDKGKLQPQDIAQMGNVINRERQFLNTQIENPKFQTPVIYTDEIQELKKKGYKVEDHVLDSIILSGSNPAKAKAASAMPAAAGAPAAPATMPQMPQLAPVRPMAPPAPVAPAMPSLMGPAEVPTPAPEKRNLTGVEEYPAGYIG
jgi:hypothetical protein